ncbi:MAG: DUF5668 domain-containing protein [bacterium]|nr:DUF5668 domain-containing protein [bacterium]
MISSGILLIIIGLLIWLNKIGVFSWQWGRDWPLILVIIGLLSLISYLEGNDKLRIWYRREKNKTEKEDEK